MIAHAAEAYEKRGASGALRTRHDLLVGPQASRGRSIALLAASILLLAALHASVSVATHPSHVIHVVLGGLYLLPIVAGALWFGLPGGLAVAASVSGAYALHVWISWSGRPMENVNQIAMIGVYLMFGTVSGLLVRARAREVALRLAARRRGERSALIEGISGLVAALGFRDDYTRQHCERVSDLAVAIGRRRGLSGEGLESLRLAALTHDIGKIGVPDDILYKPEALTPSERLRIERHPTIAAEILGRIHGARAIAEIVLCHHESPDGSGYPRGLRAEQIPLEARILRVADVYSALTDARSYKPALSPSQALRQMAEWGEGRLDLESLRELRGIVSEEERDGK
jgi:putative nucleotidyltransferase with HDIG domain